MSATVAAEVSRIAAVRILIVDDSEDDAELVAARIRQRYGDAVFDRVDCAEDMVRAIVDGHWDLVIADHSMPRFDSLGALEVVKSSGKDIPLVIYSGHLEQDTGIAAMQRGAKDFVAKDSPRLIPVVEREIENGRIRRAKERAEESVVQLANYDELTRLPNRGLFCELVQRMLASPYNSGARGMLAYIDLDRFIRINDTFGYPTGDALMRQVAERLQGLADDHTVVARLGQDEFAVYAHGVENDMAAQALTERVMRRLLPAFVQSGQEFFITGSAGVSLYPRHGATVDVLLKNAETAMFEAKKQGRNRHGFFRDEMQSGASQQFRIENDLRQAIERQQLALVYQPIIDVASGAIVGTEALIRWHHPDMGTLGPARFIPVADETGMILDIGHWVLRTACAQTVAWQRAGHRNLRVAVNFSAAQFRDEGVAEQIEAVLRDTGLPPGSLEIEITETVAMHDAETSIETLRRLKRAGIRISIDDFGTGYSSLAYLKRFPIDILKIDKSFVRDIDRDPEDAAIVRAIATLAHVLKLEVVAEGVEDAAQLRFLADEGCDRVQGHWFSQAVEPGAVPGLLAQSPKR